MAIPVAKTRFTQLDGLLQRTLMEEYVGWMELSPRDAVEWAQKSGLRHLCITLKDPFQTRGCFGDIEAMVSVGSLAGLEIGWEEALESDLHWLANALNRAFEKSPSHELRYLRLVSCGNTKLGNLQEALGFTEMLPSSLRELDLSNNDLPQDAILALLNHVPHSIQVLKLSHNRFDDKVATALGKLLPGKQIKVLNLHGAMDRLHLRHSEFPEASHITCKGAQALGSGIKKNHTLELLCLAAQRIGPQGAMALADGIIGCGTSLQILDLSCNPIEDIGGEALGNALKSGLQLRQVILRRCKLGNKSMFAFAEALKENESLQLLNLGANGPNVRAGITALAQSLTRNSTLQELHLFRCGLDLDCGRELAACIERNTALRVLGLADNGQLGSSTASKFLLALEANKARTSIEAIRLQRTFPSTLNEWELANATNPWLNRLKFESFRLNSLALVPVAATPAAE